VDAGEGARAVGAPAEAVPGVPGLMTAKPSEEEACAGSF